MSSSSSPSHRKPASLDDVLASVEKGIARIVARIAAARAKPARRTRKSTAARSKAA